MSMEAVRLYERLDRDFEVHKLKDDWSFMEWNGYISLAFQSRFMGVMLDNAREVHKVYTATFPDQEIIERVLATNEKDLLLFSHHAMGYDGRAEGFPFYNIPQHDLAEMKSRRISLYVLHVPLDKNGQYSTAVNLAKALQLDVVEEFCQIEDIKAGVICRTGIQTVADFAVYVQKIIGHEIKLRAYGEKNVKNGLVAIAGGGGSYPFVARELVQKGINLYLTGFTKPLPYFEPALEFHRIAQDGLINVIGATHYSTEKYACMEMVKYFTQLGIPAEFLQGRFYLEDL
jgi:putative NIF3 family GTP cyclohydrolase 1 type 2